MLGHKISTSYKAQNNIFAASLLYMLPIHHLAVFVSIEANKANIIQQVLNATNDGAFPAFYQKKGLVFSSLVVQDWIEEEEKHGLSQITKAAGRLLKSMSSGEQKKALLNWLFLQNPDFIILDNPFDNLDTAAQTNLAKRFAEMATNTSIIQIVNRKTDVLPFIKTAISIDTNNNIVHHQNITIYLASQSSFNFNNLLLGSVPKPLHQYVLASNELIRFENVTVKYEERTIVKNIHWKIMAGEFWQLIGPNGAGKTTLLTMITGDNPKAYGQDLFLFGKRKGSGETVWEIKEKVGYLTPSMTDLFSTRHTLEQMIISGFFDSIGLYVQPSEIQIRLANQWLQLINMQQFKHIPFCKLSLGQQRMALIARAMVKHPPLLILDEATASLDDHHAAMVVALINTIAQESSTAILYVSHRKEEGLQPQYIFELTPTTMGSVGKKINC